MVTCRFNVQSFLYRASQFCIPASKNLDMHIRSQPTCQMPTCFFIHFISSADNAYRNKKWSEPKCWVKYKMQSLQKPLLCWGLVCNLNYKELKAKRYIWTQWHKRINILVLNITAWWGFLVFLQKELSTVYSVPCEHPLIRPSEIFQKPTAGQKIC